MPPGFRGIGVNYVEGIDRDPPEPGGLPAPGPEPTEPPPRPSDARRSVTPVPIDVRITVELRP